MLALEISPDYSEEAALAGFNDPVLGAQRKATFEHAIQIWERHLSGTIPLIIKARFITIEDTNVHAQTIIPAASANLQGLPEPATWFVGSLASQLTNSDLQSGPSADHPNCHMYVEFNLSLDTLDPESGRWYYGVDGIVPGEDVSFLSTALHEIGHNLGFVHQINSSGANVPNGLPFWLLHFVVRRGSTNLFFDEMSNPQRLAALTSGEVYFSGPVLNSASVPNPGDIVDPNNPPVNGAGEVKLHAPPTLNVASAAKHLDAFHVVTPRELFMAFSATDSFINISYIKELLLDLGWSFQQAPEITASASSLRFEPRHVNDGPSGDMIVTITSSGPVSLDVASINIAELTSDADEADQFVITSSAGASTIAPTDTRDVTVAFDPDTAGSMSALLEIYSSDTHEWVERIPITGLAYDGTASVAWVDFLFAGDEMGTEEAPLNSIVDAVGFIAEGGTINAFSGTSPETLTIDKALTIVNVGSPARGTVPTSVRIGDPNARNVGIPLPRDKSTQGFVAPFRD